MTVGCRVAWYRPRWDRGKTRHSVTAWRRRSQGGGAWRSAWLMAWRSSRPPHVVEGCEAAGSGPAREKLADRHVLHGVDLTMGREERGERKAGSW